MKRLAVAMCGRLEQEQLEQPDTADQLRHRRQAGARFAELLVHGRQGRKDRGELARHGGSLGRRAEQEFGALARLPDAAQQVIQAVHERDATRAAQRAPTARVTAPL